MTLANISLFRFSVVLIIALHFFGWVFISYPPTKSLFLALTPLNLLITMVLFWANHVNNKQNYLLLFLAIAYTVGYGVEWLGVHTGKIFGIYWYGSTLGLQLDKIPLTIGLNWAVLVGVTGCIVQQYFDTYLSPILKATIGATLMVCLDFFIEPVAIKLDFWQWENGVIPLQNFVAWWATAFILHLVFHYLPFTKTNPLAWTILLAQLLFFLGFYFV